MDSCSIDGCTKSSLARGWCVKHYKRWRSTGDPMRIRRTSRPASDRFWEKVQASGPVPADRPGLGECWIWLAGKTPQGYGGFHPTKTTFELAHRWSYVELVGEIPDGLVLDHLCRRRECVNPKHLEPVTHLENLRRGAGYGLRNGMRDECINGHKYTPENTYNEPASDKVRCRQCQRDSARRRADRKRTTNAA